MADPNALQAFPAGDLDVGIQHRSRNLQPAFVLDSDTYNITSGIKQGLGPRQGFSPIPGQLGTDSTFAIGSLPNLHAAEGAALPGAGYGYYGRVQIVGIVPISLPDPSDINNRFDCYAFIMDTTAGGTHGIDIAVCSVSDNISHEEATNSIKQGFGTPSGDSSVLADPSLFSTGIVPIAGARAAPLRVALGLSSSANQGFARFASIVITGGDVPMQWILGDVGNVGDATHAPSLYFESSAQLTKPTGGATTIPCGIPTIYQYRNYQHAQRGIKVFALLASGNLNIEYTLSFVPTALIIRPDKISSKAQTNLVLSSVTATKNSVGTTYANTKLGVVNDPQCVTNTRYQAILIAQKKAFACIFQDAYRANNGKHNQWYDLTQQAIAPPTIKSIAYAEDTVLTSTCFKQWPSFVRGTRMIQAYQTGPTLGGVGTGILRAQTSYEFTYSVYDKRLGFETNVGAPVKFQTGVGDDYVGLRLFDPADDATPYTHSTQYSAYSAVGTFMPFNFSNFTDTDGTVGMMNYINFAEYRFYYRPEGSYEWLPALRIDATEFWFHPNAAIYACTGATVGSVGGQPGGFNDFSPLPNDQWTEVLTYKSRVFWFSRKQIIFSLANNVFCYPARNSGSPKGEILGAIVHNYPGQAEQDARLIIFCADGTYIGGFSGTQLQTQVQVSENESGTFDVDGTDFEARPWTSATSFSGRTASIADGILHWWGPKGVWRDGGVNTPARISPEIEPDLFKLYDPSKSEEFFSHYDDTSKEIYWFYRPRVADGYLTHALVYNTLKSTFLEARFTAKLDWAQDLDVKEATLTGGLRTVVGVTAASVQRAYFFDLRNRAGDMAPKSDMVVKQVSTPVAGTKRLTLAAGYDSTNFATIVVGDIITLDQATDYGTDSGFPFDASQIVAEVTALGAGTIDIELPSGAVLPDMSAYPAACIPIWHSTQAGAGLNGFDWKATSQYWAPAGINSFFQWLYVYLLHDVSLWYADLAPAQAHYSLAYRGMTSPGLVTDTITITDNCDGNFQIYHPLQIGDENSYGQGLKFVLSGTHRGHEWVLQYLQKSGIQEGGEPLKTFEG